MADYTLKDDLVSYWKLDNTSGDVVDSHGSNTGSIQNSVTRGESGILNNSFDFSSGGSVDVGGDSSLDFKEKISIQAWINLSSTSTATDFIYCASSGSGVWFTNRSAYVILFVDNGDGKIKFRIGEGGANIEAETTTIPQFNTWYHIVGTFDGNHIKIYVDGTEEVSLYAPRNSAQMGNNTYIGADGAEPGNNLGGNIDEVAKWDRALSSSEVSKLYNSGSGYSYDNFNEATLLDRLKAYFKLDETSGTTATDSQWTNDGTANNDRVFTTSASGIINTGADFTGGNDYISTDVLRNKALSEFSISLWVKFNTESSENDLFCRSGTSDGNFAIRRRNTSHEEIIIKQGGTWYYLEDTTTSYNTSDWFQMILTFKDGTAKLYVNDTLVDSNSSIPATISAIDQQINIGADAINAYYSDTFLDEIAVWERELTLTEIEILYSNRNAYSYDNFGSSTLTLQTSVEGTGSITLSPDKVNYNSGESVSITANPANEWNFKEWSGDLSGTTNPETLTINANKSVTAIFEVTNPEPFKATAGEKAIKSNWPHKTGLTARTTKQKGRVSNLIPRKSNVRADEKKGL